MLPLIMSPCARDTDRSTDNQAWGQIHEKVFQLQIQILSFLNTENTNTNTFYNYLKTTKYKY